MNSEKVKGAKDHNIEGKVRYSTAKRLLLGARAVLSDEEYKNLRYILKRSFREHIYNFDKKYYVSFSSIVKSVIIGIEELGLKGSSVLAQFLYIPTKSGGVSLSEVKEMFGSDVAKIVSGLIKIGELEANQSALASENFINLLLSMAEDIRVILIALAGRLYLMRHIELCTEHEAQRLTVEVSYLYAPLAHKLGLYNIKTEFEDLYLKYSDPEAYHFVEHKLSESKDARDLFIKEFIQPIDQRLRGLGLKYEIKGRVKSISSINNKLKKQKIDFEYIYDIFAIRIILDSDLDREKADCWQVYSVVTDLYIPNPKRLKDWLSIPKSNGYESLHTTVMGKNSRWFEVQIRTRRMDEIAEKGFAAHWKYKGIKSNEKRVDEWLANLREILENKSMDTTEKLKDFKLDIYEDEIYVFTPKGDLYKLPKGATVLDFAFAIHSRIGSTCVSGKVNGRNVPIRHKLNSGDQIEINTSPNQSPKRDWLNIVVTTKARNRIRQQLKEETNKQIEIAKEQLARRFKNRKIEISEAVLMRLIRKLGFKTVTDFYIKIADESLDVNSVIEQYNDLERKEAEQHEKHEATSAENYVVYTPDEVKEGVRQNDELVIDQNMTGIDYRMAKCCNPIYGDEIFGFVSTQGIKIHRTSCPNAQDLFERFGYRIVPAKWSGTPRSDYAITLRIIGNDDIGIVNNLTSIISKEKGVSMRSISIDSNDGLFQGNITVMLTDTGTLNMLVKKIKTIKGIKQVTRLN